MNQLAILLSGSAENAGTGSGSMIFSFLLPVVIVLVLFYIFMVLPQKRDHIFVKSVCCGAVVNLIANACLIPSMKSMGAVVGTLLAEMTVPVVQFIILRKELPYRKFLGYVGVYAVIGGIMLLSVRAVGSLLQAETWLNLGIQTVTGIAVYGVLCLAWWKISGKGIRLKKDWQ